MKKIIAVFTGNRAEYGLQYPVLKAIDNHPNLEYRLIVSGAHLEKDFGKTIEEIKKDGFKIYKQVDIELDESLPYATSKAIGTGILSISEALAEVKPDFLLVYADRFEGFAAVLSGTQMNIPTAHIEGGDITEGGALDDSVRHAMTKLSHLHFTTNQQASNRILAMGEANWRVHTVGFPAIDMIKEGNFAKKEELISKYSLDARKPIILFTQHSVTTEYDLAEAQILPSLQALKKLAEEDYQVIVTYPNNDMGGRRIITTINNFVGKKSHKNIRVYPSLGRYNYHGILALAAESQMKVICVGNSSSGIKETPAFFCPTVNIGSRQKGRLRAENVLDVNYNAKDIYQTIKHALSDQKFLKVCRNIENPYGEGDAGIKIAKILAESNVELKTMLRKEMTIKGELSKDGSFK